MGMYDTVILRCPICGEKMEHQTKAGDCKLGRYTITRIPPDIAGALHNSRFGCSKGHVSVLNVQMLVTLVPDDGADDDEEEAY